VLSVVSIFDPTGITNIAKALIAPLCDFSDVTTGADVDIYGEQINLGDVNPVTATAPTAT